MKINYKKLLLCALIVCVGMIGYHFAQDRNNQSDAIASALSYFDVYRQQTYALELLTEDKIPYFNGKIMFSSIYKVIPRIIWPSKPKDYGFALLNYEIYPEYSADGYMPSFGLAYTFADFGYWSIIIMGLLTGFFRNFWYKAFLHNGKNVPAFMIYALGLNSVISIVIIMFYLISSLKNDSKNTTPLLAQR